MTLVILYIVTFAVFLGIDYLGLSYIIKPTFEQHIGDIMADSPRLGPAVIFYAFYVGVLLWFVSWPALEGGKSLMWVFGSGVLIGAMAYGTYEFTNLATLKDWTWRMVATDFTWGSLLTGVSATAGVAVARAFA
ncbi:DUF2177 family protein [Roseovarius dicentrarchi]|uniref:DUF2177 family protein n=1 Tax=Roseovarius dicentrarchi TaxID=2250573 RepID=UPI000DE816E3|nr:DUF2177 family protein [Roseovarius dicentrarchi]